MRRRPFLPLLLLSVRLHLACGTFTPSGGTWRPCRSRQITDHLGGPLITLTCHRLAAEEARGDTCSESRPDSSAVQLAVLLPASDAYEGSFQRVAPAVVMALRQLRDRRLLPGRSFTLHVRDTKCSSIYAPAHAVQSYFTDRVELLLGPYCDFGLGETILWGLQECSVVILYFEIMCELLVEQKCGGRCCNCNSMPYC